VGWLIAGELVNDAGPRRNCYGHPGRAGGLLDGAKQLEGSYVPLVLAPMGKRSCSRRTNDQPYIRFGSDQPMRTGAVRSCQPAR
jgi:hypothetical protein